MLVILLAGQNPQPHNQANTSALFPACPRKDSSLFLALSTTLNLPHHGRTSMTELSVPNWLKTCSCASGSGTHSPST